MSLFRLGDPYGNTDENRQRNYCGPQLNFFLSSQKGVPSQLVIAALWSSREKDRGSMTLN